MRNHQERMHLTNQACSNKSILTQQLLAQRNIDREEWEGNFLIILKRWNSYTPLLSGGPYHCGGGYFLKWEKIGVAIDPGIDYIHNLYKAGLNILDIDIIIITHDHIDHEYSLGGIITLLFELSETQSFYMFEKGLICSDGVNTKFQNLLNRNRNWLRPINSGRYSASGGESIAFPPAWSIY